ncbi:PAS domain S-box protein [Scytonema sp. UIC 10036]|uniref:PAS domain S-box protein n=1 Tax=Scytonema sp. UIC 10036 TaxID=2304196 RepID=UPI0012DACD7A|nr:PAS domain S-box protein [Scytonema sp. UIC 10036]MUG92641.1 PAS domain S-box protein [Scytonema sp. UIC 10036]
MQALAQQILLPCLDFIIYPSPPTITGERTLLDAVAVMRQSPLQTGFVLVLEEMRVVGLLTEQNIVQVALSDMNFKTIKIFEVMETSVITLKRSQMETNILSLLTFLRLHHLPTVVVVDDEEQLVGVITYESICHAIEREGLTIGELEQTQEQLSLIESAVIHSEAKQQLQAVIDAVPGFVSWVSADGHYLGVNRRLAESLNLTTDDFVGQLVGFTQTNQKIANFIQDFVGSSELAKSCIFDMQVHGTTRNYLITANKYQQGQAAVLVGIDITETKQVERALQQAQADLVRANAELEVRVEERTQALRDINRQLMYEIADRQLIEEQLRQSQEMWQPIVDNIPQSVFWKDTTSVYLGCNRNFAQMIGLDNPDDIIGKTDFDLVCNREEARYYRECDARVMDADTPEYHVVSLHVRKDGQDAWLETTRVPLHDGEGQVMGILGTFEDISSRKQAEESLRLRDRAIAASSNGIVITDVTMPDSPIIYANKAFEQITGYSIEEVLGRNCRFLQNGDTNQLGLIELRNAITQGKGCTVVLRNYRKDGSLFWNELSISPVHDSNGNLTHYIGIQSDITERQKAAVALLVSQERLHYLLSSSPGVIYSCKPSGDFDTTFISENVTSVLGYEVQEFVQTPGFWINHVYSEDLPRIIADAAKLFEQRQVNYEYRFSHKNGSIRWMYDQAKLVLDDTGNPLEIVGYWLDITERKQLEEELKNALQKEKELNDLKSRFIAMTSHEFRTPLSTILSSAELLQHYRYKWPQEKQLSHLQRIQNAVHHMTEILDNVLLIGRAESGKLNLALEEFDLVEYCQYMVEESELNIKNQHTINFKSQNKSVQCCMDKKLLGHILSNLLSNAIKYSWENKLIEFTLQLEAEQAIFEIQDHGIGIPPDDLPHIFESFHRATNVSHIQGTGLGLAIVKRCVDTHKGDITVTSQVGVGTTFTVKLPITNDQ